MGEAARTDFLLEPETVHLNHGAFGATPIPVLRAAAALREEAEHQPTRFLTVDLPEKLRAAADQLGAYVGAQGEDIVFQENATQAVNAVLRSLVLFPGDEVLTTSHTYGAVMRTLEFVCDRAEARLNTLHMPHPVPDPQTALETITDSITPRTRLVVVDHVTSPTATVLPVAEIAAECLDRGIPILVDGAHAPGMLDLNIEALGVTWYAGNCHKWLGAPRGCGFLWTAPQRQATLRPTTISHGFANGYLAAFDWPGTKDFTPYLTVPAALDFRAQYGEERIRRYCHALAAEAGDRLAKVLDTRVGVAPQMAGFMTTVQLPSRFGPAKPDTAERVRKMLRDQHGIEVNVIPFDGAVWLRLSFYLYNTRADADRLAEALRAEAVA
jgi:isopenicillin-N epimerase